MTRGIHREHAESLMLGTHFIVYRVSRVNVCMQFIFTFDYIVKCWEIGQPDRLCRLSCLKIQIQNYTSSLEYIAGMFIENWKLVHNNSTNIHTTHDHA